MAVSNYTGPNEKSAPDPMKPARKFRVTFEFSHPRSDPGDAPVELFCHNVLAPNAGLAAIEALVSRKLPAELRFRAEDTNYYEKVYYISKIHGQPMIVDNHLLAFGPADDARTLIYTAEVQP